jgi:hypothetical protein
MQGMNLFLLAAAFCGNYSSASRFDTDVEIPGSIGSVWPRYPSLVDNKSYTGCDLFQDEFSSIFSAVAMENC